MSCTPCTGALGVGARKVSRDKEWLKLARKEDGVGGAGPKPKVKGAWERVKGKERYIKAKFSEGYA